MIHFMDAEEMIENMEEIKRISQKLKEFGFVSVAAESNNVYHLIDQTLFVLNQQRKILSNVWESLHEFESNKLSFEELQKAVSIWERERG